MQNTMKKVLVTGALAAMAAPAMAEQGLNPTQVQEVRQLMQEALSDSQTRASLLEEGGSAGVTDAGKVYLQSTGGAFTMGVGGYLQFRYYSNYENDRSNAGGEDWVDDFSMRRAKVKFDGQLGSPTFKYCLLLASYEKGGTLGAGTGTTVAEEVFITSQLFEGVELKAGRFTEAFSREDRISSAAQVSIERGPATEYFAMRRIEGIELGLKNDWAYVRQTIGDTANNNEGGYNELNNGVDASDFTAATRVDIKIDGGDWNSTAVKNNHALGNRSEQVILLGGALHYQQPSATTTKDVAKEWFYTADLTYKNGGVSVFGAYYGGIVEGKAGAADVQPYGWRAGVEVAVTDQLALYAAHDTVDADQNVDKLQAATAGINYKFNSRVMLSTDVIWVYDGPDQGNGTNTLLNADMHSGQGLIPGKTDDQDQVAIRAQLQVTF